MKRSTSLFILFLLIGTMTSCRINVPIKEMVKARMAISRAYEVKADTYDQENLKKAIEHLYACHDNVKDQKISDAKKEAIESYNFAVAAEMKSLPLLATDTLTEATKQYREAENLNAEKLAPEKLAVVEKAVTDAGNLKGENKFWESYIKSKEAIAAAAEVKSVCSAKIPSMKEDLARQKTSLEDIKKKNIESLRDDVARCDDLLNKADASITAGNLKSASIQLAESDELLKKISQQAGALTLQQRIKALRAEVDALSKSRGSKYAGDDIEVVISFLNEATALLEQNKIPEAEKKVTDAENSFKIASQKSKKAILAAKIEAVDKLIHSKRRQDAAKKYAAEIDKAQALSGEGKKLYEQDKLDESLEKLNAAESTLLALAISDEKDKLRDKDTASEKIDQKGTSSYVVRYNPKNRDCLWRIANKLYKDPRMWPLIYMANKDIIKDPDLIFPGQKFAIPPIPDKKKISEDGDDAGAKDADESTVEKKDATKDEEW